MLSHHEHMAKIDGRLTKVFEDSGGLQDLRVMGYRCDNETNNPYEKARRVKAGIGTEWTIANDGHGQQNAVAERAIATTRTLADILINSEMHSISPKMARRLWPYAHRHAVHLQLLWPTAHNPGRASPGEMRYAPGKGSNNPRWQARLMHIWGSRMIAREDDHKYKKGKCVLRGKNVYYMGVPDGFGPGFLGWDASKPTAHPRLYYNVTFQEDAHIDRHMKENAPADAHNESDVASDDEAESTHRDAGDNTNMGPVTEQLKLTDDERGSDEEIPKLLETESSSDEVEDEDVEDELNNWKQPAHGVNMGDGGMLMLWSSTDDDTSEHSDGDDEASDESQPPLEDWEVPIPKQPKGNRRRRREKSRAKARKKKRKLRPLEARDEDIAKDDDWAARLYIHEPKNGRSPTFKSLWSTLRESYGMEESLDEFMDNNGGYDSTTRPKVYESDGSRRWVWAPTRLVDRSEEIPRVDEPLDVETKDVEEEESRPPQPRGDGDGDEEPEQRSDQEAASEESEHSNSEEESPRATSAMETTHAAMFYSEQRENRQKRAVWYAGMCKADPRVDNDLGTPRDNERRFERATTLLGNVVDMAQKSVHTGTKKGRRIMRRAKSAFTMAACLVLVSVANLIKGMETVKARDFPEPRNYKDAINSEFKEM